MTTAGRCWLPCITLLLIMLLMRTTSEPLCDVRSVILDVGRTLSHPTHARAMHAQFANTNPVIVQLWRNTTRRHVYQLDWQYYAYPQIGNGSVEIINLPPESQVEVHPDHRLGIVNPSPPGPVNGVHDNAGAILLSLASPPLLPLNVSTELKFDRLPLPYHITLYLCNMTDCPYELPWRVVPIPEMPASGDESELLNDNVLIALIAWLILLTLILIAVLLALICICAELDKRRKEPARYGATPFPPHPAPVSDPPSSDPPSSDRPSSGSNSSWPARPHSRFGTPAPYDMVSSIPYGKDFPPMVERRHSSSECMAGNEYLDTPVVAF